VQLDLSQKPLSANIHSHGPSPSWGIRLVIYPIPLGVLCAKKEVRGQHTTSSLVI
jgi:hypothetical protein